MLSCTLEFHLCDSYDHLFDYYSHHTTQAFLLGVFISTDCAITLASLSYSLCLLISPKEYYRLSRIYCLLLFATAEGHFGKYL